MRQVRTKLCLRRNPHGSRKAVLTDQCISCGLCVDSCPKGALKMELAQSSSDKAWKDIWVFISQDRGVIAPVTYELLGRGRELADRKGCRLAAVGYVPRQEIRDCGGRLLAMRGGEELIHFGADEVIYCQDERLACTNADLYIEWLCREIRERKPEILLFGANAFGRELAAGIAVRMQTGLTADCTVLEIDEENGLLRQTRPAFGGNLMATIVCPEARPQMSTVRPGVMKAAEPDDSRTGTYIETVLPSEKLPLVQILSEFRAEQSDSITDARIIVDCGRGVGSKKNLKVVRAFAEKIGASLGCSRPLVESGWCEYKHQVGQTGSTVSPRLIICVGVSGAIQHLAGIGGAETIIAINNDPTAPIFQVCHYGIVGDCMEIIREMMKQLEEE